MTGRLLRSLPAKLSAKGAAFLEIGADQGKDVQSAAKAALPDADVQITRDLAGHDRVLEIRRGAHA
jgi:methylase of polypeptide subunit release factors